MARGSSAIEWEAGYPRFNGKNASKINAIAVETLGQRYGPAGAMSTEPEGAARGLGIHHFDRFFALPSHTDWASVPPPITPVSR
jgi:hypothetical protein